MTSLGNALTMKGVLIFAFVAVVVNAIPTRTGETAPVGYRNHKLIGATPVNTVQKNALQYIEGNVESADFWVDALINHQAIFRIDPEHLTVTLSILNDANVQYTILHEDVQALMDVEHPVVRNTPVQYVVDNTRYHRYSQIQSYLNTFKANYAALVPEVGTLNHKTHEDRDVSFIHLSTNGGNSKSVIFFECGIHAREWISNAVCLYFIDRLLATYNSDTQAKELLDEFDFVIVPQSNPDGYEYSHSSSSNRLWRKNRYQSGSCRGVDLNRNFDAHWGTTGVDHNCASDTYPGTKAFSEAETQNIRDKVNGLGSRVSAYISIHSYSQMILTPFGYKANTHPPQSAHIEAVSQGAADALRDVHGKIFTVGTPPELLYEASGGSYDWAIENANVPFGVTYELRPHSSDYFTGFRLPASQIVASGEEMWASLAYIVVNH